MIVCVRVRRIFGLKPSQKAMSRPPEKRSPSSGRPRSWYISVYRQRVTSKVNRSSLCSRTSIPRALLRFQSSRLDAEVALLEPGTTFCVEPGIYEPGAGAMKIEDMVVVTADGCELLSTAPYDLED